jgi:hypothetical protein
VLPALRRMVKQECLWSLLYLQGMEQGRTFRIRVPKYLPPDPNYILAHQSSRFTGYYFYIRDQVLGPIIVRVASFFPYQAQLANSLTASLHDLSPKRRWAPWPARVLNRAVPVSR